MSMWYCVGESGHNEYLSMPKKFEKLRLKKAGFMTACWYWVNWISYYFEHYKIMRFTNKIKIPSWTVPNCEMAIINPWIVCLRR
jgi:hypothetical protein